MLIFRGSPFIFLKKKGFHKELIVVFIIEKKT